MFARISIFLLSQLMLLTVHAAEQVVVGVSLDPPQDNNQKIVEPTLNVLKETFGPQNLKIVRLPLPELEKNLEDGKIDIFLSTSGLSRRMAQKGTKELATMVSDRLPNPNEAYGTLFITRKDSPINNLSDMQGHSLVANLKGGFYGHQIGLGELVRQGHDPYTFFSSVHYVGRDLKKVVDAVLKGKADVGSVSSCFLEDTYPKDGEVWRNLKGIGVKPNATGCLASTDLYPNWSVSTMPRADPAVARKAAEALLAMPKAEGGMGWSIATDSTKTDELFKDLQIGPFGFLKDWFSKEFRIRYAGWLLLGIGLFASSLLLSFILGQIVRKRTRSLTESLKKQNELRRKEKAVSEKLSALERLGVVDQLSSIVVHELRQPLTTIRAFLFGAKKKAEKGVLTSEEALTVFEKIEAQSNRAQRIVDDVRKYAKQKAGKYEKFSLSAAVDSALKDFKDSGSYFGALQVAVNENITMRGSRLEIELVVHNLLKNAAESISQHQRRHPLISIALSKEDDKAVLIVSDNGGSLTKSPSNVLSSSKPEGLGLGLLIVKAIAARHGGSFRLDVDDKRATACLTLPIPEDLNEK